MHCVPIIVTVSSKELTLYISLNFFKILNATNVSKVISFNLKKHYQVILLGNFSYAKDPNKLKFTISMAWFYKYQVSYSSPNKLNAANAVGIILA